MENNTAGLIIELIIGFIAAVSAGIGWLNRRESGRIKIQMAEAETRRLAEKGTIDNTANLIGVIESVVLGLKPTADLLKDASITMENTSTVTKQLVEITQDVLDKAKNTQDVLTGAIQTMNAKAVERDRQVESLPGEVKDAMAQDLEKIPKAVEEALAPKIEALKTEIGTLIQSLDEKLTDRIETATDKIPNRTTELVRGELAVLKRTIETSLKEMLETAKGVQIPDDGPGEAQTPQPEPNEAHKEN